eukprot:388709-Amphidinium_carterae.1
MCFPLQFPNFCQNQILVNRISCVKAQPGQDDAELGDLPEPAASLGSEQLSFKQSGLEMPMQPSLVEKTWTRTDHGVKRFVASKDGGPRWEKVWKRVTYNLDSGDLIAEELVSDMTKKDLNRPLPEKVKNIRTVLYYRTTEKSDVEDKVEKSRKELVEFNIPEEPPPDKKVKLKAKSTPITSQQ